ncbi:MAG: hypothetical protein R3C69_03965 [Geminicoccaceae bacterium]
MLVTAFARTEALIEAEATRAGVGWSFARDELRRPGRFAPGLQRASPTRWQPPGEPAMRLDTIAAHDAVPMARLCPSIVVATPSIGGICHSPSRTPGPRTSPSASTCLPAWLLVEGPDLAKAGETAS